MAAPWGSYAKPYRKEIWPKFEEAFTFKPKQCPKCGAGEHAIFAELIHEYHDARDVMFKCFVCGLAIVPKIEPMIEIRKEVKTPRRNEP